MDSQSPRSTLTPLALSAVESQAWGYLRATLSCETTGSVMNVLSKCKDFESAPGDVQRWLHTNLPKLVEEQTFGLSGEDQRSLDTSLLDLDTSVEGEYFKSFKGTLLLPRSGSERIPTPVSILLTSRALHGDIRLYSREPKLKSRDMLKQALQEATTRKQSVLHFKPTRSNSEYISGQERVVGSRGWYQDLYRNPTKRYLCESIITFSWSLSTAQEINSSLNADEKSVLAGLIIDSRQIDNILASLSATDKADDLPDSEGIALMRSQFSESIGQRSYVAEKVVVPLQLFGDVWGDKEETIQEWPTRFGLTIEAFDEDISP